MTRSLLTSARALPAAAEVNIYSYRQPKLIQPPLDTFTEETRGETNIALVLAMIAHHGEGCARNWLQGIKENLARSPQGSDRGQVGAIQAGKYDISLGNTYYVDAMLEGEEQARWANSVTVLFPAFEDGGPHVKTFGAAITSAAPNPEVDPSDLVASWGERSRRTTWI